MQFKYDIQNLGPVLGTLRKVKNSVKHMRAFFKTAGGLIIESVTRNFMAGGRPKWEPLTPSTIRRRRQGEGTGAPKPLRDTNVLMVSIGRPSKDGIFEVGNKEVTVGTNVPYARYHQFGTRHMPARPFMMVQKEDEQKIVQAALDEIKKAAK